MAEEHLCNRKNRCKERSASNYGYTSGGAVGRSIADFAGPSGEGSTRKDPRTAPFSNVAKGPRTAPSSNV